ncbi:hypothetical protein APASM_4215 [Actinosynnema pretiosum subsp. pretiosum]|nr:hypothetical protein APASM_4215 [Actinosynnema pretiosum subsp. pretiosum]
MQRETRRQQGHHPDRRSRPPPPPGAAGQVPDRMIGHRRGRRIRRIAVCAGNPVRRAGAGSAVRTPGGRSAEHRAPDGPFRRERHVAAGVSAPARAGRTSPPGRFGPRSGSGMMVAPGPLTRRWSQWWNGTLCRPGCPTSPRSPCRR